MSTPIRVGIAFTTVTQKRLSDLCKKLNVSRSRLIESLSTLDDDVIEAQVKLHNSRVYAQKEQNSAAKKAVAKRISQLSPEQLSAILEVINNG